MTDCAAPSGPLGCPQNINGRRIVPPRTCRHKAKPGEKFCSLHRASRGSVASSDGGSWGHPNSPVCCAQPARRYTSGAGNAAIDLLGTPQRPRRTDSLAREIRRYVPADRRRATWDAKGREGERLTAVRVQRRSEMAKVMCSWQDGLDQNMHVRMGRDDGRVSDDTICGAVDRKSCIVATLASRFVILTEGKLCPDCVRSLERIGQVLLTVEEFDIAIGPEQAAVRRKHATDANAFLATGVYILGGTP